MRQYLAQQGPLLVSVDNNDAADAGPQRPKGAFDLGDHAARDHAVRDKGARLVRREAGNRPFFGIVYARYVCRQYKPARSERRGYRHGVIVGVDVEGPMVRAAADGIQNDDFFLSKLGLNGEGVDSRRQAGPVGRDVLRRALKRFGMDKAMIFPRGAVNRTAVLFERFSNHQADVAHDARDHVHDGRVCHAASVRTLCQGKPGFLQRRVDLGTAAVNKHDADAAALKELKLAGDFRQEFRIFGNRIAANFYHDGLAGIGPEFVHHFGNISKRKAVFRHGALRVQGALQKKVFLITGGLSVVAKSGFFQAFGGGMTAIGILGASGYTGAELLRLLLAHPNVTIAALTANRNAGQPAGALLPHLIGLPLPDLCRNEDVDFGRVDFVFCALPHGTTQDVIAALPAKVRVVDLSADFRFADTRQYEACYEQAHRAPELQQEAVYGLTELARDKVRGARLVANPGCYPTAAQLPLIPLLRAGVIEADDIIIDAKSGVSGAGREMKLGNLYSEAAEGLQAYGVAKHRHAPEIEQGLSEAAGKPVVANFTPHLVPMNRGIFASIYVRLAKGKTVADVQRVWRETYRDEPFIQVLADGHLPGTRQVRGTNNCQIAVVADRVPGRAIILSAIDNLVKGAAGQAVQNMNAMFGWPETCALGQTAMFP